MERQPRLSSVKRVGQLAHAPLAFAEQLDDLESGLVGECVEELDRSLRPIVGSYGHSSNISRKVVVSIGTPNDDYQPGRSASRLEATG